MFALFQLVPGGNGVAPSSASLIVVACTRDTAHRDAGDGAVVMGRTSFDKNEGDGGWGDAGPVGDTPCFVVTHDKPTASYPPVFRFITDGVASAIEQAKDAAGDKVVGLHGATILQQALPLGLVDEIRVHIIPVLLGGGTLLFSTLDSAINLERIEARVTPAATHIGFRVVR